jgi:hypothetical protein
MLFDRLVSVQIGPPGGAGIEFDDFFRISFEGEKSASRYANKCTVKIYNLNDTTLHQVIVEGNILQLFIGYEEDQGLQFVFSGEITRVLPVSEPPDRILEVECFDGLKELQETRVSLGFARGTPVDAVVKSIVAILQLPLAENYLPISETFSNGFSFVGEARKALTIVLNKIDREWSIQNGAIQILEDSETTRNQIVLISPATGMIGIPENLDQNEGKLSFSPIRKRRYKIKSLLRPEISVNDKIQIESSIINGIFKVRKHEYEGDNFDNEWTSTFEVREI